MVSHCPKYANMEISLSFLGSGIPHNDFDLMFFASRDSGIALNRKNSQEFELEALAFSTCFLRSVL